MIIKNFELTLERVEEFMRAGEVAAKYNADAADEANVKIHEHLAKCQEDVSLALIDSIDHAKEFGIRSERARVLRLWYDFHINLEDSNEKTIPTSGWRNKQASIHLAHVIAGGGESLWAGEEGEYEPECPIDADFAEEPSEKGDFREAEPNSPNNEFLIKLIRLMAKAGTQRDGMKAAWSFSEISYGLKVAMPQVGDDELFLALKDLVIRKLVVERPMGRSIESAYALVDDYKSGLVWIDSGSEKDECVTTSDGEKLLLELRAALQSNLDLNGKLLPWSIRSLEFALRRKFCWVHADDIRAAMLTIKECREVGDGQYLWVGPTR